MIAGGLLAAFMVPFLSVCPGGLFCSDWEKDGGPEAAERDAFQAAIDVVMADNKLFEVTPSTSGAGGEKINGTGTQLHATLELQPYMSAAATTYCYRWQSSGRITFQYDADADGYCGINSDQIFP